MTALFRKYYLALAFILIVLFAVPFLLPAQSVMTASVRGPRTNVVIDAGHGGEDGGASSDAGVLESHINLQIVLRLEQLLALMGHDLVMLRTEDTALYSENCHTFSEKKVSDLKNRVSAVNAVDNALLISIHQNHFSESRYSGAQVFYSSAPGSRELAQVTQDMLRAALDPHNKREIKQASSVYLMEKTRCTAILVECGFLSNYQEAENLQKAPYQKRIICGISAALSKYLEGERAREV